MFARAQEQARLVGLRVPESLGQVCCCSAHRGFLEIWLQLQVESGRLDAGFPRCWHRRLALAWPRLAAVKAMVKNYTLHSKVPALYVSEFARTLDLKGAEDADEKALRSLLDLVPDLGLATELELTDRRQQSSQSQVLVMAAQPGALQNTLDVYQQPELVGGHRRQIVVTQAARTVFLLLNHHHQGRGETKIKFGRCMLAGRVYTPKGFLLLSRGHYTALVLTREGWYLCDDLRPKCELVQPDKVLSCSSAVRMVVLRDDSDLQCSRLPLANFTNAGNTCHLSAVLQLLFQATEFVDALPVRDPRG
jgi:hypothetical protein